MNYIKIAIVDMKSELDQNCCPNSLEYKFELALILFGTPYCLSLHKTLRNEWFSSISSFETIFSFICRFWFEYIEKMNIHFPIFWPMLFTIYVSPIFDINHLTNFAVENFTIQWNSYLNTLNINLQRELKLILKWLRKLWSCGEQPQNWTHLF